MTGWESVKAMRKVIASLIVACAMVTATVADESLRIDLRTLREGELKIFLWAGLPIGVYRRTDSDQRRLQHASFSEFVDPLDLRLIESLREQARSEGADVSTRYGQETVAVSGGPLRSHRLEYFVFVNLSTVYGCSLTLRREAGIPILFDPCHGERYDVAGRIYLQPTTSYWRNLFIPPHRYVDEYFLEVGRSASPPFTLRLTPDFRQFDPAQYQTALLAAVWRNWAVLEQSVAAKVSLAKMAEDDFSAAHNIVRDAPISLLKKAKANGLDLDALSPTDAPPWISLLWSGDIERLEYVLTSGANPDGAARFAGERKSPLHFAFDLTATGVDVGARVRLLLRYGADPRLRHQGASACDLAKTRRDAGLLSAFKEACKFGI